MNFSGGFAARRTVALLALAGSVPAAALAEAPALRPHVMVISLDTTRADYLSVYGHPWSQTPELEALAAESIVFDACQTPAPTTLASHTSLFTGTYPHTHGVARNRFRVHEDNVMLAEVLRRHGYRTAGFIGAYPLHSDFNFPQGFEHYDDSLKDGRTSSEGNVRPAEAVVDSFLAFLEGADVARPHFFFLHFYDPHGPYEPPRAFLKRYQAEPGSSSERARRADRGARGKLVRYAAEITAVDHHIGRALDALRDRDLLNRTLLLVTNDHGETLRDKRPYFAHGRDVYEVTTRGIGILRLPGGKHGGRRMAQVISTIDFMPTLLREARVPAPAAIEGKSIDLEKAIRGKLEPRTVFSEATKPRDPELEARTPWANRNKPKSIRRGDHKLIWYPLEGREELYDVVADPGEAHDLLPAADEALRALAEKLGRDLRRWADVRGTIPSEALADDESDVHERLKALGYL